MIASIRYGKAYIKQGFINLLFKTFTLLENLVIDNLIFSKKPFNGFKWLHFYWTRDSEIIKKIFKENTHFRAGKYFNTVILRPDSLTTTTFHNPDRAARMAVLKKSFNNAKTQSEIIKESVNHFENKVKEFGTDIVNVTAINTSAYSMAKCGLKLNEGNTKRFTKLTSKYSTHYSPTVFYMSRLKWMMPFIFWLHPEIKHQQDEMDREIINLINKNDGWDYDTDGSWITDSKAEYEKGNMSLTGHISDVRDIFISSGLTNVTLNWTLYCLAKHQNELEKVRNNKKWARYAVMEALRLYPPIVMGSYNKNGEFSFVKRKSCPVFVASIIGTQHSSDNFDNPKEFIPGRFVNGISEMQGKWIPFGGGVRMCPGRSFIMQILPKIVYEIVNKYDIYPVCEVEPDFKMTLMPKNNYLPLQIRKREQRNDY